MSHLITLTQSLKEAEILKLKPSSLYSIKNYDYVSHESEEGKRYAQVVYDETSCAFILHYYQDSNFNQYLYDEFGNRISDFIFEVGIQNLKLI